MLFSWDFEYNQFHLVKYYLIDNVIWINQQPLNFAFVNDTNTYTRLPNKCCLNQYIEAIPSYVF